MRFFLAIALVLLSAGFLKAQETYPVASIPKPLLARAGAVIRLAETTIEVKDLDEVSYRIKKVITILNPSAQKEADLYIGYDKTTSIKSIKGIVYNEFGIPEGKISEKSFEDRSSVSNISLYEDDRVKYFRPAAASYPYTVAYEYETRTRQSMYFPSWYAGNDLKVAVEKSSLRVIAPLSFTLRHQELNYPGKVEVNTSGQTKTYTWAVENVPALKEEPFSPNYEEYLINVKLAPTDFAFKNLKGNFSNWTELGKWVSDNLLNGRDQLPPETVTYVRGLVSGISSPKEKARKIYEFMQSKTRYISVQIGIGGFQPYPASDVDRLGYGDCKGLVNFMHALLKATGVESYYTLVYAGQFKRDLSPAFTSIQGNHAILCLPFENDTTWLECTDKFAPFGFLGDFTDDREVLVCTPAGGKLMRTPKLKPEDNRQIRKANFELSGEGNLSGTVITTFEGAQYDNHYSLINEPFSEQKKKLPDLYPLPNLDITSIQLKQDKGMKPATIEDISFSSYNYAHMNDGKLHLKLNCLNRQDWVPKEVKNRSTPVFINRGYYDEDVITYRLPAGFKLNIHPETKSVSSPFGEYSASITIDGNKLIYSRKMKLNEGSFKSDQYEELLSFFQKVSDEDSVQVFLEKI